jgi:hypothetical protein
MTAEQRWGTTASARGSTKIERSRLARREPTHGGSALHLLDGSRLCISTRIPRSLGSRRASSNGCRRDHELHPVQMSGPAMFRNPQGRTGPQEPRRRRPRRSSTARADPSDGSPGRPRLRAARDGMPCHVDVVALELSRHCSEWGRRVPSAGTKWVESCSQPSWLEPDDSATTSK